MHQRAASGFDCKMAKVGTGGIFLSSVARIDLENRLLALWGLHSVKDGLKGSCAKF